jgi:gamma-glutamylaminecyclotransferase
MSSHLVFVFGTLKEGFPNFRSNDGVRLPGVFLTEQRLPLCLVGERHSPWLIHLPGQGHQVAGQIFRVDAAALERMDMLERITQPDGYRRIAIRIVADGHSVEVVGPVLAYVKQPEQFSPSDVRFGPLAEYTLAHAALYRVRAADSDNPPQAPCRRR